MSQVTHEQAWAWLHAGRAGLGRLEQVELDEHLASCAACQGYAAHLAAMEPALNRALHTLWDGERLPFRPSNRNQALAADHPRQSNKWLTGLIVAASLVVLAAMLLFVLGQLDQPRPAVPPTATGPVALTPSGLIAFVGAGDIYVMHADGSQVIDVSSDHGDDAAPAWSPDGRQLAFISQHTGRPEVFLVNSDGSGLRQLTHTPGDSGYAYQATWMPDGRLAVVLIAKQAADTRNGTVLMSVDDGRTTAVLQTNNPAQWSPDGKWMAFANDDGTPYMSLYVAFGDGSNAQKILSANPDFVGPKGTPLSFAWSPDGSHLAYMVQEGPMSATQPNPGAGQQPVRIRTYTVIPYGSDRQLLLDRGAEQGDVRGLNWSPDGRYLLSLVDDNRTGCWTIGLLDRVSRAFTDLHVDCIAAAARLPSWSPDSRFVTYATGTGVVVLDVTQWLQQPGTGVTRLQGRTGDDSSPIWQPFGLAVAAVPAVTTATAATTEAGLASTPLPGLIAFASRQGNDFEIYTMHADGSQAVDVSNDPRRDYSPGWTPDGKQVAFISERTGRPEVFVVKPDGSGLVQVTHNGANEFAWSPDGTRLAVSGPSSGPANARNGVLQIVHLDGQETATLAQPGEEPKWSPDGNSLAFSGYDEHDNLDLYVARGDGTDAQLVVSTTSVISGSGHLLIGAAWSPDSSHLAYLQEGPLLDPGPNQHWDLATLRAQIYTVRPDGSDRQLLLDLFPAPNGILGVNWSPDGKYLLYSASVGDTGCLHLHLLQVATHVDTELQGVCHGLRTVLPDWSPDGRTLAFTAEASNPGYGDSVVLLDVAKALQNPGKVVVTWLAGSPVPAGGSSLDLDPVWQPLGH